MSVSDKDGSGCATLNLNPAEFKLYFDDNPCCQIKSYNSKKIDAIVISEEGSNEQADQVGIQDRKQEDNFNMCVTSLKVIKIPSLEESRGFLEGKDDEGMKTPTNLDQKISVSLNSPPGAPRKPKAKPLKKRKASRRHSRLLLDLNSSELEAFFPPIFSAHDLGDDRKFKKKFSQESS